MSLDPTPSDEELIAKQQRMLTFGRAVAIQRNLPFPPVIRLGPDSPLRRKSAKEKNERHPTTRLKASNEEHLIQVAFFEWANDEVNVVAIPELALLYAVPNGGKRSIGVAKKLKAEGVKPGVPDVILPVARKGFHGLAIEFKKPGGALSPSQADWIAALTKQGWKIVIHHTTEGAQADVLTYLTL